MVEIPYLSRATSQIVLDHALACHYERDAAESHIPLVPPI